MKKMCIFCKIIRREIPSNIIYEDEKYLAILDISQSTKGHSLVFPKKHCESILDLDESLSKEIFGVVKKLTFKLNKTLEPSGFNIISNNGLDAGQSIFHFHIHVIPRYLNDDVSIVLPNNYDKLEKNFLNDLRDNIKKIE